jgi:hypothetical protein
VWLPNLDANKFDNIHGNGYGIQLPSAVQVCKNNDHNKAMFGAAFPSHTFNVGAHNFKTLAAHLMRSDKKVNSVKAHMHAVHFMRHVMNNPAYVSIIYDTATHQHVGTFTDEFKTLMGNNNDATEKTTTAPEPTKSVQRPQSIPLFQKIAASVVVNNNTDHAEDGAAGSKPRRKQNSETSKPSHVKRKVDETVRL